VIVVADTTPMVVVARIGRLELLRDLCAEVLVPRAVYNELVERRTTAPRVDALREAIWIRVVDVGPSEAASRSPLARLDAGEAAAIRLAADLPAELLLIDEKAGRAAARSFGIPVRGTLGVIVEAKRLGLDLASFDLLTTATNVLAPSRC
jgi:predicted nucleic acid-binding protein